MLIRITLLAELSTSQISPHSVIKSIRNSFLVFHLSATCRITVDKLQMCSAK